jgi:hypothetical protein
MTCNKSLLYAAAFISLLNCRQEPAIQKERVLVAGQSFIRYQRPGHASDPVIAILGGDQDWSVLARQFAVRSYQVFITSNIQPSHAGEILMNLTGRSGNKKMALLAADSSAVQIMRFAAMDSGVAALGLLTLPIMPADTLRSLANQLKNRSHLYIVAEQDPLLPDSTARLYYSILPEDKKMVQLASNRHGVDLLKTDMEPIIRRVFLLQFENDFKGRP